MSPVRIYLSSKHSILQWLHNSPLYIGEIEKIDHERKGQTNIPNDAKNRSYVYTFCFSFILLSLHVFLFLSLFDNNWKYFLSYYTMNHGRSKKAKNTKKILIINFWMILREALRQIFIGIKLSKILSITQSPLYICFSLVFYWYPIRPYT